MKFGILSFALASVFVSGLALSASTAHAQATTSTGFSIWKCTKCHSDPGPNEEPMPRLEGMPTKYFLKAMKDYQTGARHGYTAWRLMSRRVNLSAQTIAELAEFFAKQPTKPGEPSEPELMALGKEIYEKGIPGKDVDSCKGCHGKMGEGKGLTPRLAGQYIYFQVRQLKNYANGNLEFNEDMTDLSKKMTPAEMTAVSAYLQSL